MVPANRAGVGLSRLLRHDAPLGVMANAPTYDRHMTNLANYINLSVNDIESIKLGAQKISAFGAGGGLLGLPGDFTPPSRFVRAAIYSQSASPNATADDAVLSAFHILNQFDIPKGSVVNSAAGEKMDEITEWTSVADLKNLRWYFRTSRTNRSTWSILSGPSRPRARSQLSRWKEPSSRSPMSRPTPRRSRLPHDK
jgi:penicillin V acylase-like amidase (Ntn superfamily)